MAAQEDEIKSLKEKNNELAQKVQYFKTTAAQRENEKLELMKEINELRLKVIRLKSGGAVEARKLDAALQSASEEALSHLVQASSAVARTIELAKTYMRDREGADIVAQYPRWSSISNSTEKVHRVPPMMIGGQSIQPVVSLSRATLNVNNARQISRSPNINRNVTVRAVPMHMLQDVYIPLTRIDMRVIPNNNDTGPEPAADDSADNATFNASLEDVAEEPENLTDVDEYETSRRLDMATDVEPEAEEQTPPSYRVRVENPLEGPSWLLDAPRRAALEPDSTTEEAAPNTDSPEPAVTPSPEEARTFTPTVRRRKRPAPATPPPAPATPPHTPPAPAAERTPNGSELLCSRVLQVLVPKLPACAAASPGKRRAAAPRFDAPSPNGATDSRVIVSEDLESPAGEMQSGEPRTPDRRDEGRPPRGHGGQAGWRGDRGDREDSYRNHGSQAQESYRRDSGDSDSGGDAGREGRTRRNRKPVTYKEKPLNRKLRR